MEQRNVDLSPAELLPILPGHNSPGRFERVLRAGKFAVTTELAPPDSADPAQVYERASVFDGYVDAIALSYVECSCLWLTYSCRLFTDYADLLSR